MKIKIKIKEVIDGCLPERVENSKSEWIDLKLGESITLKKGDFVIASLGVAMELPKGMEAIINPRSSLYKNYNVLLVNSQGVIDNTYNGDNDIWKAPLLAMKATTIPVGTRILQFRIQPSQFATVGQKLKYLLSRKLVLKQVKILNNVDRSGFGSTNTKF